MESYKVLELQKYLDRRGTFARTFDRNWMNLNIAQTNLSFNPQAHTLRGLHYQKSGPEENKLVTLVSGSVFLVIVDLRRQSSKFLEPVTFFLDSPMNQSIYIPSGYATGWISTSSDTTLQYLMSARFEECTYSGLRYNDPILNIPWPSKPDVISEQDSNWPYLTITK